MKKIIFLISLFYSLNLQAQKVIKETFFDPEGKANINNLKEVQVDEAKNELRLYFITKSTEKKLKAEELIFDLDFNLKKSENIVEEYEKIKEKYKLSFSLNFCPESKEPLLSVEANTYTGQVVFKKGYIDRYYNWNTGFCDDRFKVVEKVKPKGDDGEKIKLVNYWSNNAIQNYYRSISVAAYNMRQARASLLFASLLWGGNKQVMTGNEGDVVFLGLVSGGMRDPNNGKNYTFQRFDVAKLEKTNEIPLSFDVQAAPVFHKILSNGNIAYIFQRMDNQIEFLEVDFNGNTQRRFKINSPLDAVWIVDDMNELEDGSIIVTGLASKTKATKTIPSFIYAPHSIQTNLLMYAVKVEGLQVMKIGKNQIEWVNLIKNEEFKPTFVKISQDKKSKPYTGGRLIIGDVTASKNGNLVITGQKKVTKGKKIVMAEMVCFVLDSKGKLISNFATIMRDKNKYNLYTPSNHSILNSPTTNDFYWVVYEVAGMHKFSGRTLYYPRIARIKEDGKSGEAFVEFGAKKAFLDDKFPVVYVNDKTYIFIGANRNGKELWFSKVEFE